MTFLRLRSTPLQTRFCVVGCFRISFRFVPRHPLTYTTRGFSLSTTPSRRFALIWFREFRFTCMGRSIPGGKYSTTLQIKVAPGARGHSVLHQQMGTYLFGRETSDETH